jgi:hypothetical protein
MELAQDPVQWQALLLVVLNLQCLATSLARRLVLNQSDSIEECHFSLYLYSHLYKQQVVNWSQG